MPMRRLIKLRPAVKRNVGKLIKFWLIFQRLLMGDNSLIVLAFGKLFDVHPGYLSFSPFFFVLSSVATLVFNSASRIRFCFCFTSS